MKNQKNWFYIDFRTLRIFWDQKLNLATFEGEGSACSSPGNTPIIVTQKTKRFGRFFKHGPILLIKKYNHITIEDAHT